MARLQTPQQVFSRLGRAKFRAVSPKGDNSAAKPKKRQRKSTKIKVKDNAPVELLGDSYEQIEVNMP